MKVNVDPIKCSGYTLCNQILPSVFKLDDWGFASVHGVNVTPGCEEKVREAAQACPENAIRIEEE
ncbi:MAG: ferredoxin [Actinomycetota bacterium]|jgi:ferredoxin|nr:ferredoxin [Actinomycetota bacterium]